MLPDQRERGASMGRENTIKWLESIDAKQEDEDDKEDLPEAEKEWGKASSNREDSNNNVDSWDLDPRQRTWKQSAIYFWQSQKGRELSMGSSIILAISLSVVGLACILSEALTEDTEEEVVNRETINQFFIVMYLSSILAMVALMTLGFFNKLTIDKKHKSHSNSFTMAGLTVLGSGGIIYKGLVLAMYATRPGCESNIAITKTTLGAIFIITEVAFLWRFSGTRINYSLPMTLISRVLLMMIIATNLCIWFNTIIEETLHDIHDGVGSHSVSIMASDPVNSNETDPCSSSEGLDKLTSPYLFPLLIEFCVVGSTMMLAIWEKAGLGLKVNEKIKKAKRDRIVAFTGVDVKEDEQMDALDHQMEAMTAMTTTGSVAAHVEHSHDNHHSSSSTGFLLGWVVLLTSVVTVMVGLFNAYSSAGDTRVLGTIAYASNLSFTLAVLVALPVAFYQISVLTHKDNEIKAERKRSRGNSYHVPERKVSVARHLDKDLVTITFYFLLAFKLMCMIAGYEESDWLLFSDGFICIFMGLIQSTFIAWYAFDKRSTKEIHRTTKPGQQTLEFLRLCNLALWLGNTFLLKNRLAKSIPNEVFGRNAWVIISNIVQPLTILYYFHCTMCIAEILHLCYTEKYIGLVRKSKQNNELDN